MRDRFSLEKVLEMKKEHPGAKVRRASRVPPPLQLVADKVGSTAALA